MSETHTDSSNTTSQRRLDRWRDRGASLVEYALLLALIAVVCVSALQVLGGTLSERIEGDAEQLQQAGS